MIGWSDTTTQALSVLTSPPGGGFGLATTFANAAFGDLKFAPGHAVAAFGADISTEPVS